MLQQKRIRMSDLRRREARQAMIFLLPWIAGFVVFVLGPMVASLILSFTSYQIFQPIRFTGLTNYVRMFSGSDVVSDSNVSPC